MSEQKQKMQHFYARKKHLRGKKLLICVFVLFVPFVLFVLFVRVMVSSSVGSGHPG